MKFLTSIAILMTLSFSQATFADGTIPWPFAWGAECEFPWQEFHGTWEMRDQEQNHYLNVTIVKDVEGGKIVQLIEQDQNMQIVAYGQGFVAKGEKILRVFLFDWDAKGSMTGKWMIFRSYMSGDARGAESPARRSDSKAEICKIGEPVMALTIQSKYSQVEEDKDRSRKNYVLQKLKRAIYLFW